MCENINIISSIITSLHINIPVISVICLIVILLAQGLVEAMLSEPNSCEAQLSQKTGMVLSKPSAEVPSRPTRGFSSAV